MVQGCLVGLALALLLVGAVSGTVARHIVQIVPIVVALGLVRTRPDVGSYAALPIFAFWTLVVVLIWLFLLGLSRIANGHYSPTEIAATVVMFGCSLVGAVNAIQLGRSLHPLRRVLMFFLMLVLQFVVMWISFLEFVAND